MSLKKSLLVIWKILRHFVNRIISYDKYSLLKRENLTHTIQMQLPQEQKVFLNFFLKFWNLHQILKIFFKKVTLIANAFPKLQLSKSMVRSMCKKHGFTVPFKKQHGKRAKTLFKSKRQHLYHIYSPLQRQLSLEKFLLVISKILRLFVNTFTTDDKYSLLNKDNLIKPIQTQLYHKKTFFKFFSKVLKSRLNFEHFQKKGDSDS